MLVQCILPFFTGYHEVSEAKRSGFGDIQGPKPYKFIGFGDIQGLSDASREANNGPPGASRDASSGPPDASSAPPGNLQGPPASGPPGFVGHELRQPIRDRQTPNS